MLGWSSNSFIALSAGPLIFPTFYTVWRLPWIAKDATMVEKNWLVLPQL